MEKKEIYCLNIEILSKWVTIFEGTLTQCAKVLAGMPNSSTNVEIRKCERKKLGKLKLTVPKDVVTDGTTVRRGCKIKYHGNKN